MSERLDDPEALGDLRERLRKLREETEERTAQLARHASHAESVRSRQRVVGIGIAAAIALGSLLSLIDLENLNSDALASVAGLAGTFLGLLLYLRGSSVRPSLNADSSQRYLRREIATLNSEVQNLKEAQNAPEGKTLDDVVDVLRPTITDQLVAELENRFGDESRDAAALARVRTILEAAGTRLLGEIESLRLRSQVNLAIGVTTTMAAVGLLVYLVLGTPTESSNSAADLVAHYIPRLSVAIFVEVFAFFFLRLYRATLDETKNYQSWLTALQLQHVSLEATWTSSNTDARTVLARDMIHPAQADGAASKEFADLDEGTVLSEILRVLNKGTPKSV